MNTLRNTCLSAVLLAAALPAWAGHKNQPDRPGRPPQAVAPVAPPAALPPPPIQPPDAPRQTTPASPTPAPPYRMGPGDEFDLVETRQPVLNRHYILAPDGGVSIPLLGHQVLSGLTPQEAQARLQETLGRSFRDPELSLLMTGCKNYRVLVFGDVNTPGEYMFDREADLLGLLTRAGGLRKPELVCSAVVTRGAGEIYQVDLVALLREGRTTLAIPLHPGDRVHVRTVAEGGYHLMGEVKSPGYFPLEQGMTVLHAINLAGGLTETAAAGRVVRIRPLANGTSDVLPVDLSRAATGAVQPGLVPLKAGDVVYVPISGLGKFNYYLRQVTPGLNMILLGDAVNRTVK